MIWNFLNYFLSAITLPGSATKRLPIIIDPKFVDMDSVHDCSVCNEPLGLPRSDGLVEKAAILPCSHIFGDLCISRWLETESLNQDCPNCRRKMVYRECGHTIKPCDISQAPKCVGESDMPENCFGCQRGGELEEVLNIMNERWLAEEQVLEGLKLHVSSMFGDMGVSTPESIDDRIVDLKGRWRSAAEAACRYFEEKQGGRVQW